ncbi:protein amalgam [Nilaparvata lugens]|uniref:protein amalgam n=1 Tax=Nilaparvata lugens TaxID=108931 RepID=UPI00193E2CA8|nr:protein amalgam [Nilaparvata lugens]
MLCLFVSILLIIGVQRPTSVHGVPARGGDKKLVPKFISHGQTFRAVIGDTLVLPCEVQDLGAFVILWRRGSAVLTADKIMVTRDERYRLVDGFNLEIGNVMPQDAGDYVCQIGDGDTRDQIHTVEILESQMTCQMSEDEPLPSGEKASEGFQITLEKVDRHQAGVYQCTASNGVGEPVTVDMQLDVLYAPEVEVERSWVHSGEGYEAQLVCIVHGEPQPSTVWYQDSFTLEPTERRTMDSRGNKHTLTIRNVQSSDFGNYSCVAENSLGKSRKYMELSGRPSPAQFRSPPYSTSKNSYNLTWLVESYPPLEEVRLLYRKLMLNDSYQTPGKWHDVVLQPSNGETFSHLMSYTIRNLESASVFEAIVQAKNRYGWNEVSDLYQFYTRGPGEHVYDFPADPNMKDMELIAPSSGQSSSGHLAISSFILVLFSTSAFQLT